MTSPRRQAILDAAQDLFLRCGYSGTAIADIQAASGASTGSIYHAFGSKEGIALALARRAIDGWTAATLAAQQADTARGLIHATVAGLVVWGSGDSGGFIMLGQMRGIEGDGTLAQFLDEGRRESGKALERFMARGEIRAMPWMLAQALILGPAYEFLRIGQRFAPPLPIEEAVQCLSEMAWAAVAPLGA